MLKPQNGALALETDYEIVERFAATSSPQSTTTNPNNHRKCPAKDQMMVKLETLSHRSPKKMQDLALPAADYRTDPPLLHRLVMSSDT